MLFHAPAFSNKTSLFQMHLFKQEATSAFTRSSLRPITTNLVWPGGTDAAVAPLRSPASMDAIASQGLILFGFTFLPLLALQNDSAFRMRLF